MYFYPLQVTVMIMNNFVCIVKVEFFKIVARKSWWMVLGLVVIVQPLLAMMSSSELVKIGLDASPATHPDLVQAIPPLEYLGFDDIVPFGLLPMVVLGGLIGASEYRNHNLRVTLLCCSNRISVFLAKLIAILTSITIISFLSIYLTIMVTHAKLGALGLNPFTLSPITWAFIAYSILTWMLLTLLAFSIGMLSRNAIVPFIFLIPQIYGLAHYVASKWSLGEYLPVTAGELLMASPTNTLSHDPIKGGFILGAWTILLLLGAMYSFVRRDVGGAY